MNRRAALAALGSAGLGLLAMHLPSFSVDPPKDDDLKAALNKFTASSRERLLHMVKAPGFDGRISAAEVKDVCKCEGKSVDELMIALLGLAKAYARPPISKYHVGTVARGSAATCTWAPISSFSAARSVFPYTGSRRPFRAHTCTRIAVFRPSP